MRDTIPLRRDRCHFDLSAIFVAESPPIPAGGSKQSDFFLTKKWGGFMKGRCRKYKFDSHDVVGHTATPLIPSARYRRSPRHLLFVWIRHASGKNQKSTKAVAIPYREWEIIPRTSLEILEILGEADGGYFFNFVNKKQTKKEERRNNMTDKAQNSMNRFREIDRRRRILARLNDPKH